MTSNEKLEAIKTILDPDGDGVYVFDDPYTGDAGRIEQVCELLGLRTAND